MEKNRLRQHIFLFASLVYLWIYSPLSSYLMAEEWNRLFYLSGLPAAVGLVWGILYVGEAFRLVLLKRGWVCVFYPGMNWVIAEVLGVWIMGSTAILCAWIPFNRPVIYQCLFTGIVLISAYWVKPKVLCAPWHRLSNIGKRSRVFKWSLLLAFGAFVLRGTNAFLLINGTEQLHNTLSFSKYLFRGIDFNSYSLDNHFLLLGSYETFGVFIRSFAQNDFAHQLVSQLTTFLLTIGGMCLVLATIPWVLRRIPIFAVVLMAWPTMLNFAPTDTIAFKPDWIGILSAAIATLALFRQWFQPNIEKQNGLMRMVFIFSGIATTMKLSALPYIIFLIPTSWILSVYRQKKIHKIHFLMPIIYLLVCSVFFGKNIAWLHNPVFPGFQTIFQKPERLENTTTFNTFKINKITRKTPDFKDNLSGYYRFWLHHPEFFIPIIILGLLLWKGLVPYGIWGCLGYLAGYLTLVVFYFYPDIYQRYVAFTYILLLMWTVLGLLAIQKQVNSTLFYGFIIGFLILMLSHSSADSNFSKSLDWWMRGKSPEAYRFETDSMDQIYAEINKQCPHPGRLLNRKYRNYFYANFDVVSLIDLRGNPYRPEVYDTYQINFVIQSKTGPVMEETRAMTRQDPWFIDNFSIVFQTSNLLLWKKNSFHECFLESRPLTTMLF